MEHNYDIFTGEIIAIHETSPYTITLKTKGMQQWQGIPVTIDPRCTFYRGDKKPKGVGILEVGNIVEVTYIVNEGVTIAFNIIVKPEK